MKRTIIANSFSETQILGKKYAQNIKNEQIICLYGDLGAGKTTFVQGFGEGLGVTKKIVSPTFIIMRTYELTNHPTKKYFYHVDLYRIENETDVEVLGLLEIMQDPESIVAIEWPEKIEDILPINRINLFFRYLDDDKREIVIEGHNAN